MLLAATGLTSQIQNNHIKSALLLAGFPVLLALMMGAFYGGLDLMTQNGAGDLLRAKQAALDGITRTGPFVLLFTGVWFMIAFFFHGGIMRMAAHSRPVTRTEMPRLYNLLENLCISRGLSMPAFDLIDSPALNAFASGLGDKSWRITVTRGLVEALDDEELEAVLAHELTHIMNRDVRLLIIAVVFTGMIGFFTEMVWRMLIHGRRPNYYARRGQGKGNGAALMILALAVLAIGYIFALFIRFALSRKREHLADLGAVELTRRPEAMMRALLRIKGKDAVTGMPGEVQQMCVENSQSFMGIFATHPPIEERVRTLSEATRTPVPALLVSLRRPPKRPLEGPWGERKTA